MSWSVVSNAKQKKERTRFLKLMATKNAQLVRIRSENSMAWQLFRSGDPSKDIWADDFVNAAASAGVIEEDGVKRYCLSLAGQMALRRLLTQGDEYSSQQRELGRNSLTKTLVNLQESPLIWLASRKDKKGRSLLRPEQISAGERLRADYTFAAMMPNVGTGWRMERLGAGPNAGASSDLSGDVVAARQRVERILSSMEPLLARVVVDVCCHLKGMGTVEAEHGWPARSGKVVLQIALTSLADRYGERMVGPDDRG